MQRSVLLAVLVIFLMPTASAAYDDIEFTEIFSGDGGDSDPYHDIESIAIGEPGDGTFVMKVAIADMNFPDSGMGSHFWGFQTPAGDVFAGFDYAGAPSGRNIGEPILPTECIIDPAANVGFCQWTYASVMVDVGSALNNIWSTTDGGHEQAITLPFDVIPGGSIEDWPNWGSGGAYTLTGCTKVGGCGGGGPVVPSISFEELTGDAVEILVDSSAPTNGTTIWNWTTEAESIEIGYDVTVAAGSADMKIMDGAGAVVLSLSFTADGAKTEVFDAAAPGDWTIEVEQSGFQGTLALTLAPAEEEETQTGSGTGTSTKTNSTATSTVTSTQGTATESETATPDEDSPGLGVIAVLGLIGAAMVAVRRRL